MSIGLSLLVFSIYLRLLGTPLPWYAVGIQLYMSSATDVLSRCPQIEQKLMQTSSQLHSGPEEEGADKRQCSRNLSQCWLQLLLLKQTRRFCTNKGDPPLYRSLNTSCMLVTMKLCKRWGSQIFQIVIGCWDSGWALQSHSFSHFQYPTKYVYIF